MNGWMILWTTLLGGGVLGMICLLLFVTAGAVRELHESLDELSGNAATDGVENSQDLTGNKL